MKHCYFQVKLLGFSVYIQRLVKWVVLECVVACAGLYQIFSTKISLLSYLEMSSSTQYEAPTGSWNLKIRIGGSYDLDGYRRAIAALYGLWLFVLVGVAIVTIFARRSRNGVLRVQKIWLPIGLAIV